jgi:hypothetical protein
MVQAAAGFPKDGTPRAVLLLEDAGGYFDCSVDGSDTWVSKGGDDVRVDRSAAGVDVPTFSGGSSGLCPAPADPDSTVDSAVVLKTSARAVTARVSVHARGGTRTATVPTRHGYVYVTTRVGGAAALKPARVTLELLDAAGERLPIQRYAQSVTERLSYPLEVCTSDPER